jgi:carbonic anhydrase
MHEIDKFITGFKHFQRSYFGENRELFDRLKQHQQPRTLIISCCDSRVDPAILTDSEPGELFVVRNVANLVPPCESGGGLHGISAALEFGVCSLEVAHIIVLGHSQCGGIRALMEDNYGSGEDGFVAQWMNIASSARDKIRQELPHKSFELQTRACEQAAILLSLENLLTFPWITQRVDNGTLFLHGWYFDLAQGELLGYDAEKKSMVPLSGTTVSP